MNLPPVPDPVAGPLQPEIAATREVLAGLMALWRGQSDLTIDDARRLAVLVFNGARAVALLLYHQARLSHLTPDTAWIDGVLDQLSEEMGVDL